jgi:hypothetical protein
MADVEIGSFIVAGVKPTADANGRYVPIRTTVDDSYSPPRFVVELPDRSLRQLGIVTMGGGTSVVGATNGALPGIYTQKMDNTGGLAGTSPKYIGFAAPGTATSAASWAIQLLGYDANDAINSVTWAGGSIAFTNIWDNRAGLNYS